MNIVALVGRVADTPKVNTTKTQKEFANFNITVPHPFFDGQENTFRCTAWRKACDVAKTMNPGDLISIGGFLQQRQYTTKGGDEREAFEVNADRIEVLSTGGAARQEEPKDADDPFGNE